MSDGERAAAVTAITGMVAGGYAVEADLQEGAVECARCGERLRAGADVTAALACYEGHTWELYGVYCRGHGVETVAATMGESADEQAVVAATLEPTGYRDPRGEHHPQAVSLGGVALLEYSPLSYE